MNTDIANIVKSKISSLPFVDQIAGLVRIATKSDNDGDRQYIKSFPVSCETSQANCSTGKYQDLIPNSKYKSVIYFEDGGINLISRNAATFNYESKLTLVCWLNQKKLGKTNCSVSALAVGAILKALDVSKYFNSTPYTRIQIEVDSEIIKNKDIFSKYTYDEKVTEYLLYPFDYFALNLSVKFTIPETCLSDWTNGTEGCE